MKKLTILVIAIIILVGIYFAVTMTKDKTPNTNQDKQNQADTNQTGKQNYNEFAGQVLKEGTGDRVTKEGDMIAVHYIGALVDGTKFDSSLDRGQPFIFQLGAGQVIKGWDVGLLNMKVGERRRLFIPADMAYGDRAMGDIIPANSPLVFEVELLAIKDEDVEPQSEQQTEEGVLEETDEE